jgi:very-short-patch-repair endonuclease
MTAIDRRSSSQHGLITHAQLLELGVSRARLRTMVSTGHLVRLSRGIYRMPGAPRTWLQAAKAATLAGSGAVLSHRAAAHLLLSETQPGSARIEVSVRRGQRRPMRDGVKAHSSRSLVASDITTRAGIPCTSALRTLVDLAEQIPETELDELVSDFVSRRLVTPRALCEFLTTGGRGRWRPGATSLRRSVDTAIGWKAESVAEQRLQQLWRRAGLPPAEPQVEVRDEAGGLVARLDLAVPELKIAVEMDGYRYHGDPRSFHRDRLRTMRLAALGWRVIHVTPAAVREDSALVVKAVRRAIAEAREATDPPRRASPVAVTARSCLPALTTAA